MEIHVSVCTVFAAVLLACVMAPLHAEDNVLLIQPAPQGYVVWHTEGLNQLSDDEVIELMANAEPEGGKEIPTPFGPARAYVLPEGVVIRLLAAQRDQSLLVDRDACGHVQLWHAEGATQLTETQLSDIVLSALPEGGPRLRLNGKYAKGFLGRLGVTATLWNVPRRN